MARTPPPPAARGLAASASPPREAAQRLRLVPARRRQRKPVRHDDAPGSPRRYAERQLGIAPHRSFGSRACWRLAGLGASVAPAQNQDDACTGGEVVAEGRGARGAQRAARSASHAERVAAPNRARHRRIGWPRASSRGYRAIDDRPRCKHRVWSSCGDEDFKTSNAHKGVLGEQRMKELMTATSRHGYGNDVTITRTPACPVSLRGRGAGTSRQVRAAGRTCTRRPISGVGSGDETR